ncbi:unnamed protein product [Tilletia controversa]|nr:unnamed protein product [Tilletia controversa]
MDQELSPEQHRSIRAHGRLQSWPAVPETDVAQRVFEDHKSYTEVILADLAAELLEQPKHFALTDLRGAGYYGPYHAMLMAKAVQEKLKSAVPTADPIAISCAAEQILPLLFIRLIQENASCSFHHAVHLISISRLYGLVTFPASIFVVNERLNPPPTLARSFVPQRQLSLSPDSGQHPPVPVNHTAAQHSSRHRPHDEANLSRPNAAVADNGSDPVMDERVPNEMATLGRADEGFGHNNNGAMMDVEQAQEGVNLDNIAVMADVKRAQEGVDNDNNAVMADVGRVQEIDLEVRVGISAPESKHITPAPPAAVGSLHPPPPQEAQPPVPAPESRHTTPAPPAAAGPLHPPSPQEAPPPSVVDAAPHAQEAPPPFAPAAPPAAPNLDDRDVAAIEQPRFVGLAPRPQAVVNEQPVATWTPPPAWRNTGRYPLKGAPRPIGRGGFGMVYLCVDLLIPGKEVAKKRELIREPDKIPPRYLRREIHFLQRLQGHTNIVEISDVIYNDQVAEPYIDIIMPAALMSLDKLIRQYPSGVPEIQAKTYVIQIIEAIQWMHSRNILHLDLKPHNVLLYPEHVCKVTDFGLSRPKDNCRLGSPTGTLGFRPPEELFRNHFAHQSMDIWPIGTVYIELRTGCHLFDVSSELACFRSMINFVGTRTSLVFRDLAPDAGIGGARTFKIRQADHRLIMGLHPIERQFVLYLMQLEPLDRPSARMASRHQFWNSSPLPDRSLVFPL